MRAWCWAGRGKQLVDEDPLQPLFVLFGAPASIADEQPADLGRHECVDDVRSVALAQLRPEGAGPGQGTGDLRLAELPVPRLLGEQGSRVRIGGRRAHEDPVNRLGSRHDAAGDAGETRQLVPGISVREKRTDVGPVIQRDGLVVTGYGDVEQRLEDPQFGREQPVHRRGRDIRQVADGLDRRSGIAAFEEQRPCGLHDRGTSQAGPGLAALAVTRAALPGSSVINPRLALAEAVKRKPAAVVSVAWGVAVGGTFACLLPYLLNEWHFHRPLPYWAVAQAAGGLLIGAGLVPLVRSFVEFANADGTPVPLASPPRLVVSGPYRYVRNPIYVGFLAILLGEVLPFGSSGLLEYAAVAWCIGAAAVRFYEEPTLARKVGAEYQDYRRAVRALGSPAASMDAQRADRTGRT